MHLDVELEVFVVVIADKRNGHEVFSDRVETLLHGEVGALDAHVVAFVERLEDFEGLDGCERNVFVDLGDDARENQLDVLQLVEEELQFADFLLLLELLGLCKQTLSKRHHDTYINIVQKVFAACI